MGTIELSIRVQMANTHSFTTRTIILRDEEERKKNQFANLYSQHEQTRNFYHRFINGVK